MQISLEKKGTIVRMILNGRFDFNSHRVFCHARDDALQTEGLRGIEADFNRVDYIDSSALGMLLALREKACCANIEFTMVNCTGMVRRVIEVANLQRLFNIR